MLIIGGSGLSAEQFQSAIKGGIAKINIFTDLGLAAKEQMIAEANSEKGSYFSIGAAAKKAFAERCKHFIEVFGSAGRA